MSFWICTEERPLTTHFYYFTGYYDLPADQNDISSALFKNTCHCDSIKHVSSCVSCDKPRNGIIHYDAEIMHAKLKYTRGNIKSDDSCDKIADIYLLLILHVPIDEETYSNYDQ